MMKAYYPFSKGYIRIDSDDTHVVAIRRVDEKGVDHQPSVLSDQAYQQLKEYFDGERTVFDFPFLQEGTAFQQRVWDALCRIPYGETRTYGEIAAAIGNPKAARAVGMANNKNRLMIVVPCHRVIGANGRLVGYAGGLDMKTYLLELEQGQRTS